MKDKKDRPHILLVYYHDFSLPLRRSVSDHIFSFGKLDSIKVSFLNVAFGVPKSLLSCDFDLIVFETTLLSYIRWIDLPYQEAVAPFQKLKMIKGKKVVLPQDEFVRTNRINQFIREFDVRVVFSVAESSEWSKIYSNIDQRHVQFYQLLTGYLDDDFVHIVEKLNKEKIRRNIPIGYRAWRAEYWLGRHGILKTKIAEKITEYATSLGIEVNISTKEEDTFYGNDWIRFLLQCQYVIGVEGGSSLLDEDGKIREATHQYLKEHPKASFEEVEKHCFAGKDGSLKLLAISPRHLEACVTKTCQILIEGNYNGILKPGLHYIELKKDFSNIFDVFEQLKNDKKREEMVERAYRDVVESNLYNYRSFASAVVTKGMEDAAIIPKKNSQLFLYKMNQARELWIWSVVRFYKVYTQPLFICSKLWLKGKLPESLWIKLKKVKKGVRNLKLFE